MGKKHKAQYSKYIQILIMEMSGNTANHQKDNENFSMAKNNW